MVGAMYCAMVYHMLMYMWMCSARHGHTLGYVICLGMCRARVDHMPRCMTYVGGSSLCQVRIRAHMLVDREA